MVAWALHAGLYSQLRRRYRRRSLTLAGSLISAGAGTYLGLVLTRPDAINVLLSPAVGAAVAAIVCWALYRASRRVLAGAATRPLLALAAIVGAAIGAYSAFLVADAPGSRLYLSWVVSCLLAGVVGLALYRGLYMHMITRARSPLIMLVASLGVLLALTAATTIVFQAAPRPLPEAFGSDPWVIGGATNQGVQRLHHRRRRRRLRGLAAAPQAPAPSAKPCARSATTRRVAKVVGINTTAVIAVVFFIGAVYAALAGLLSGHDTAIQPRMGLLLLLKGWIASVVGGLGNPYGAIVGGFALGMVEQFGIWDLAGEWRDVVSFGVLILFLSFWPKGLVPRK